MNEILSRYGKQGVTVLGVTDQPRTKIIEMAQKRGVNYPIGFDRDGETFGAYDIEECEFIFLVDPNGDIVWMGSKTGGLNAEIDRLLAKHPGLGESLAATQLSRACELWDNGKYYDGFKLLESVAARFGGAAAARKTELEADAAAMEKVKADLLVKTCDKWLNDAYNLAANEDYAGAKELYLKIVETAPNSAQAVEAQAKLDKIAAILGQ
jgi:hypothetical protein